MKDPTDLPVEAPAACAAAVVPGRAGWSRRAFIAQGAIAGGAALWSNFPASAWAAESARADAAYQPVALSPAELDTLKSVLARLLPADELGPGAVEARVHVYIDTSLAGALKEHLPAYRQYLPEFEALAVTSGVASFGALAPQAQDELLRQAEQGKPRPAMKGFFKLLLEHMSEGMFGDPMYGGNADFAGWDLLSYPGVKLLFTEAEQALGTVVKQAHMSGATLGAKPVL